MTAASIERIEDITTYSPPLHNDTLNRRLVPATLGAGFELVHGTLAPGGAADRHLHPTEWQVIVMLDGSGLIALGDGPEEEVGAGMIVRIPPGVPHVFRVTGTVPAKLLVLYSPPLGEGSFVSA